MKMKIITKSCLITATALLISLRAKPAQAWFQICNKSSQSVAVAFAYLDVPDSRNYCDAFGNCRPLSGGEKLWNSKGWWRLNSGECVGVYPHELKKRNSYYYVYARTLDGSSYWKGKNYFCVVDNIYQQFGLAYADSRCEGQNTRKLAFQQVYTGNAKNYTYSLTD